MFTCVICRFTQELDAVAVLMTASAQCICLGCFARQTGRAKPMPTALRRQLMAILAEASVAA